MWIREEKQKIDEILRHKPLKFEMKYANNFGVDTKMDAVMDYVEDNGYKCLIINEDNKIGFKAVRIIEEDLILE
jgi:hypothetical protein